MILTDREIQISLKEKLLTIDPIPHPEAYSSTTVDLTLGPFLTEWEHAVGMQLRPGAPGYKYSAITKLHKKCATTGYLVKPRHFVLGWTRERIELPIRSRIAARVEGKSSLARLGIGVHVTAPTIQAGFVGQIQLEIFNFGPHEIIFDEGMKICQLVFEQTVGTPLKGYSGLFINQTSEG